MLELIPDYDNSKDDDSEDGNLSGEFLDWEGDRLVKDLGGDVFMRAFTYAMLANTGRDAEGVETELYDSGTLHHMNTYHDWLENFVLIMPKSISTTDKCYFQANGKGNLHIKIPNSKMTNSILLTDIPYCPKMGLILISISKLVDARFDPHFTSRCKIFYRRDKATRDIPQRNGLYWVDNSMKTGGEIGGVAAEVVLIEELHCRMGHHYPYPPFSSLLPFSSIGVYGGCQGAFPFSPCAFWSP